MYCLSGLAHGEQVTDGRAITAIGCHLGWQVCFVQIAGDPVGPDECKSDQIRWNAEDSVNGQSQLALLTAAYISKEHVIFGLSDTCFEMQKEFPTFSWSWITGGG
jgi:hypothetical protein